MNEATEPGSGITLHEGTIATKKLLTSPNDDCSNSDACFFVVQGPKRKCGRKGRRKSGTKKHRAGRNQKRKYKPYHRMSVSERQKVDDRNEKRNTRKREYYHSCGIPLAPPNTNQFLLEDRPETNLLLKKFEGDGQNFDNSDLSSLSEFDGSDSESDEFQVMWKRECNQRYQSMSDQELRELYMRLEDELAENERKRDEEFTKIRIFQDEVRNYEITNEVLSKMNEKLAKVLEDAHSKADKEVDKKELSLENDASFADTV